MQITQNENTRVKIPALIHLTRLGYKYISLKDTAFEFNAETNILKNIFREQFLSINRHCGLDQQSPEKAKVAKSNALRL